MTVRTTPPVRPADTAELALLPALEAAADTLFVPLGITGLPPAAPAEELAGAAAVLVAGQPPAGFARIDLVGGGAHLEQLAVHPDHARRGIGSALVRGALRWAREHGYAELTLTTYRDVPWNGPFYAGLGFAEVEEPGEALAAVRREEVALGLDRHGPRVVMSCRTGTGAR